MQTKVNRFTGEFHGYDEIEKSTPPVGAALASTICSDLVAPSSSSVVPPSGFLAYTRKSIPWDAMSNISEAFEAKNYTQALIDNYPNSLREYGALYHRLHGHHPLDWITLKDPQFNTPDAFHHIIIDSVTKQGIPLLPEGVTHYLAELLGVEIKDVAPWVLNNAFDLTIGSLSISQGSYLCYLAFTGNLEWGMKTALITFGGGSLSIAGGVTTHNPLLVAGGGLQIAAGAKSAIDYYSVPRILDVPVPDILGGIGIGAGIGLVLTSAIIASREGPFWTVENGKTLLRQTIISASLGGLASISSFISLPAVALYSGGLFTYQAALLDSKDPGFHSNLATVSRFYDLLQENEPTHELVLNPGYSTGLEGTAFQTPDRFREQL